MGQTGEVSLAGPDQLMRSVSRELIENPEQYQKDAIAAGTPPDVAARAVQVKGSILIQPVRTEAVQAALAGETGITIAPGYLGAENIVAYTPLDIPGLQWVMISTVDTSEAFA